MEKLIIIQAEIIETQGIKRSNPHLLSSPVDFISLRITEPETD